MKLIVYQLHLVCLFYGKSRVNQKYCSLMFLSFSYRENQSVSNSTVKQDSLFLYLSLSLTHLYSPSLSFSLSLILRLLPSLPYMRSPLGRLSVCLGATIDRHVKTALKPVTHSPAESRASVKAIICSSVPLISHRSHYY